MREIKFRGLSEGSESKWVYGYYYIDGAGEPAIGEYIINPKTVGQFTGFEDKNSEEIYDGDILCFLYDQKHSEGGFIANTRAYHKENCIHVFWHEAYGQWWVSNALIKSTRRQPLHEILETRLTKWEIIGNQYELPDILK